MKSHAMRHGTISAKIKTNSDCSSMVVFLNMLFFKVGIHVEMPKAAPKKSICHFQKLMMILKRNKQNTVRLP